MNVRRDRGVALPSPVAAISVAAIVVAAIAFAVTGFSGNDNKDVTPQAAPTTSVSTPAASTSGTPTGTASTSPSSTPTTDTSFDKAKIHLSFYNQGTVKGLAKDMAAKALAAGWTDQAVGRQPLSGPYPENAIYYDPKFEAAARQLGLDLGITKVTTGDHPVTGRILVVLVTRPN